ncbi:MAG: hypothetical protein KBC06_00020 [Candidatus Pacebacteria bacterium]|nr:hypothetical protein [Candidatus Paceibacterota bacterium]
MKAETKNCQNCQKEFLIEESDFNFYEKIKVPPPTWCGECRFVRRISSTNVWTLFWRNCDKCEKRMISVYPESQKITVYCPTCWWGDSWDGTEYAMDYDPSRPFLAQVKELSMKTPYPAVETEHLTLKNSEYTNAIAYSKNCFMVVSADYCESVYYSSILNGMKWSADCLRGWESELCYESTGFAKGYNVFFSEEFDNCVDVWFSRNCHSSSNCIGCVNLRGASYQIFNVQYSKEEYNQKLKEFGFDSWSNLQKFEKVTREFWLTKPYRDYHANSFNLNVSGEFVYYSKNSKEGYILNYAENSNWCQFITVNGIKDCADYSGWGNNAELVYESASVGNNVSDVKFSCFCFPDVVGVEYCLWCIAGKNNFGCVGLKRKSYSILNKQYSKEEYEKLKSQIILDMKNNPYIDEKGKVWGYGEFFRPGFSKHDYNHSTAMKFFPKTKEQAIKEGYSWNDDVAPTVTCTIKSESLPDIIADTDDSILQEIIECMSCTRGYKIVSGELELLRKMNLPVPHECPKCRESRRFSRMNRPGMYHRNCAKCEAPIYTPYAPERPEIVYCAKCYLAEFA